jgi:hypothetical protein
MTAIAKFWTWVGQLFIPFAIGWSVYIRGGLADSPPAMGVLVSRAYWGLLITLMTGSILIWTIAWYIRSAKKRGAAILIPPNTNFEDDNSRNPIISWGTIIAFLFAIMLALTIFGARYAQSRIYQWDAEQPIENGFWASRAKAHESGCAKEPCFAVGQRIDASKNEIFGVNEYILFVTDGGLAVFILTAVLGIYYLIKNILFTRVPLFES